MLWLELELTCTEGRQGTTRPVPTSAHIMHTYDNTKMQSESGSTSYAGGEVGRWR